MYDEMEKGVKINGLIEFLLWKAFNLPKKVHES
jgi:hypothetical protein